MSTELEREGHFGTANFPEVVLHIHQQSKTGMLRAERDEMIKVIYFRDGEISFASSNEESDRLGHVFMRAGKLTEQQLLSAMSKVDAKTSLGKTFIALGYITPKELLWGARKQVEDILLSLYYWRDGRYQFIEGPLPKKIANLRLPTPQLLAKTIQLVADRDWILERLGSLDTVFSTRAGAFEDVKSLELGDEVEIIVAKVDGTRSVRDICALSRMDDFTVSKVLYALHLLGMLEIEKGADGEEAAFAYNAEETGADPMGLSSLSDDMNFSDLFSDDEPRREGARSAADTQGAAVASSSAADTVTFTVPDLQPDAGNETMTISPAEAAALRARSAAGRTRTEELQPAVAEEPQAIHEEETIVVPGIDEPRPAEHVALSEPEREEQGESSFRDLFQDDDASDADRAEPHPEPWATPPAHDDDEPEIHFVSETEAPADVEPSPFDAAEKAETHEEDEEVLIEETEEEESPAAEEATVTRSTSSLLADHEPSPWDEVDSEATFVPSGIAAAAPMIPAAAASERFDTVRMGHEQRGAAELSSMPDLEELRRGGDEPTAIGLKLGDPSAPPPPPPAPRPSPAAAAKIPPVGGERDFADLFKDDPLAARAPKPAAKPSAASPALLAATPAPARPAPSRSRPAPTATPSRSNLGPVLIGAGALLLIAAITVYINWEFLKPSLPAGLVALISGPDVKPTATPRPHPTTPTPEASPSPTEEPPTPPTAEATETVPPPPTAIATKPTPTKTPTPTPAATKTPAPTPSATPATPVAGGAGGDAKDALAKGQELARAGKYDDAARVFRAVTLDKSAPRYSIQLELDCQVSSLQDAIRNGGQSPSLFFVPKSLKGRSCYMVLWGLYTTEAAAKADLSALPGPLVESGAKPRVSRLDAP